MFINRVYIEISCFHTVLWPFRVLFFPSLSLSPYIFRFLKIAFCLRYFWKGVQATTIPAANFLFAQCDFRETRIIFRWKFIFPLILSVELGLALKLLAIDCVDKMARYNMPFANEYTNRSTKFAQTKIIICGSIIRYTRGGSFHIHTSCFFIFVTLYHLYLLNEIGS